jgi:hypothetical protein
MEVIRSIRLKQSTWDILKEYGDKNERPATIQARYIIELWAQDPKWFFEWEQALLKRFNQLKEKI